MVNITEDCAEQEIAKIKSSKNKAPKNKNNQTITILKTEKQHQQHHNNNNNQY